MKTLLILNLISTWTLIAFLSVRPYWRRLQFQKDTAFGETRFNIIFWKGPVGTAPNWGRTIFSRLLRKEVWPSVK